MTAAEIFEAYGLYIAIAVVALIILIWFVSRANRKTSVVRESMTKDVLDEGAERASRNQALIDSGSPAPTLSDVANTQKVAHAGAAADAEAGAQVVPSKPAAPIDDDLTRIKGLGPKLAAMLNNMGVTKFSEIAAWQEADINRIDAKLGKFQGRIQRDNWVEQAKLLSAGAESDFANKFGNNG